MLYDPTSAFMEPLIPKTSLDLLLDGESSHGGQRRDRTKAKAQRAARRRSRGS